MKNKILVIGKEGRLARYTADKKKLDDYDRSYVPVWQRQPGSFRMPEKTHRTLSSMRSGTCREM